MGTNGIKLSPPAKVERINSQKQLAGDLKIALITPCPFNIMTSMVTLAGGLASFPLVLYELNAEEAGELKIA